MFEYFPHHYGWNFATLLAMGLGANLSEVDDACGELMEISVGNNQAATEEFFYGWKTVGDRLFALALQDRNAGRGLSASGKFRRAAIYYLIAERTQSPGFAPRRELYLRMQEAFRCFLDSGAHDCEAVAIPFLGEVLPALVVKARGAQPAPCVLHFVGLDAMKEQIFLSGLPQELARRGVSTVIVDLPGAGESLRLRNLHTTLDQESVATACIDYLHTRADVDVERIGAAAIGLAGYTALRAMAADTRLGCCAVLGATYDWKETFQQYLTGGDDQQPLPFFFEHVKWAFGLRSIDECMQMASKMHLRDVLHCIDRPVLMLHGMNEHTQRLELARRTYDGCALSPARTLRVLSTGEGGAEYCGIDNFPIAFDAISDWLVDTLHTSRPASEIGGIGLRPERSSSYIRR